MEKQRINKFHASHLINERITQDAVSYKGICVDEKDAERTQHVLNFTKSKTNEQRHTRTYRWLHKIFWRIADPMSKSNCWWHRCDPNTKNAKNKINILIFDVFFFVVCLLRIFGRFILSFCLWAHVRGVSVFCALRHAMSMFGFSLPTKTKIQKK